MKTKFNANHIGIVILAAFMLFGASCLKRGKAYGSFIIKGRCLKDSGAPRANADVYVEYVYNASYIGGSYERGKAGSGTTDSAGNFMFQCALYDGVDYTFEPVSYYIAPGEDTIDMGVVQW